MFRVGLNTEQVAGGYWGTGDSCLDKDRRGDLLNNVCTRPIIGWPSKVPSKPIAVCKFLGSLRPFRLLDPGTRGSRIRLGSFSQNKVEHGLN